MLSVRLSVCPSVCLPPRNCWITFELLKQSQENFEGQLTLSCNNLLANFVTLGSSGSYIFQNIWSSYSFNHMTIKHGSSELMLKFYKIDVTYFWIFSKGLRYWYLKSTFSRVPVMNSTKNIFLAIKYKNDFTLKFNF